MNRTEELSTTIQERLKMCYTILQEYRWLTNSYILVRENTIEFNQMLF